MYRTFCECARVLQKDGLFIITCDVLPLLLDQLATVINTSGFTFAGEVTLGQPIDAVQTQMYGSPLTCFRAVLKKK